MQQISYVKFFFVTQLCFFAILYNPTKLHGQAKATITNVAFNTPKAFIENKGQYGTTYKGQETMGNILYGFEGHSMPILFTKKGLIFLQRKVNSLSHKEKEKLEKQGIPEEEIEHQKTATDRAITMEWIGANENVAIIQEEKTYDYHTYGLLQEKAYGYKKITYKNLYNGIDLVYNFTNNEKIGFEYSLEVAAGADISQIKMQYGGAVKKIKINKEGKLIVDSDIEGIEQTVPISFYSSTTSQSENPNSKTLIPNSQTLVTKYTLKNNQITFTINNYNTTQPLTIDPFISSTSNLDGVNAGKAKDIDYDYAGNVYVTGGGDAATNHRLAKYNAAGVLQWTFNGVLTMPVWEFGANMGGWVVEKPNGNIYLGQGFNINGFKVVKLNNNGLYDNYSTDINTNFVENWKMIWICSNGTPQILIFWGGGIIKYKFWFINSSYNHYFFLKYYRNPFCFTWRVWFRCCTRYN